MFGAKGDFSLEKIPWSEEELGIRGHREEAYRGVAGMPDTLRAGERVAEMRMEDMDKLRCDLECVFCVHREISKGFKLRCGRTTVMLKKLQGVPWEKDSLKGNRKGSRKTIKVATADVQA